jgi:hypothetical protein
MSPLNRDRPSLAIHRLWRKRRGTRGNPATDEDEDVRLYKRVRLLQKKYRDKQKLSGNLSRGENGIKFTTLTGNFGVDGTNQPNMNDVTSTLPQVFDDILPELSWVSSFCILSHQNRRQALLISQNTFRVVLTLSQEHWDSLFKNDSGMEWLPQNYAAKEAQDFRGGALAPLAARPDRAEGKAKVEERVYVNPRNRSRPRRNQLRLPKLLWILQKKHAEVEI